MLVAAVSLAACGEAAETSSAKAAEPVRAEAEATDGAEVFVRGVYAAYGDGPDGRGPGEDVWSDAMQALRSANAEAANGEAGYLGADPICSCQDWSGLTVRSVTVTPSGPGRADAAVEFSNFEPANVTRQTLKLVREGGAWKIDDIAWGPGHDLTGEPPMKAGLQASTAELNAMSAEGE